jgi:hypothetical protein
MGVKKIPKETEEERKKKSREIMLQITLGGTGKGALIEDAKLRISIS